jgi:membrane protein implicated in regulation of membrane protease activity
MFVVGLLLILFGVLAIIAALFGSAGTADFLGFDLSAFAIFLIGLAAGAAILWGYSISKLGVKRSMRHRRESKQLEELSEKLDRVDEDRRRDVDEDKL